MWSGKKDVAVGLSFTAFWLGSIVEVVGSGGGVPAVGKGIAMATGAVVLGLLGMVVFVVGAGALSD